MSAEDIFEQVKQLLVDQLGVDEDSISMDSDFIDDLNADSLDIVDLIITLESEYDISIPDEDAQRLKTVGDAVDFIVEMRNKV
ncbi:MAG: acyl carrier protein [Clostridiaceae bacterium]|nr:acyl carrier protein [Clostridiaceae bacterium]